MNIPKRENGKKLGFGMVQFKTIEGASRAVKEMNGKSILGLSIYLIYSLFSLVIDNFSFIVYNFA